MFGVVEVEGVGLRRVVRVPVRLEEEESKKAKKQKTNVARNVCFFECNSIYLARLVLR